MVAKRSANELSEARGVGGTIIYQGRGPYLTFPAARRGTNFRWHRRDSRDGNPPRHKKHHCLCSVEDLFLDMCPIFAVGLRRSPLGSQSSITVCATSYGLGSHMRSAFMVLALLHVGRAVRDQVDEPFDIPLPPAEETAKEKAEQNQRHRIWTKRSDSSGDLATWRPKRRYRKSAATWMALLDNQVCQCCFIPTGCGAMLGFRSTGVSISVYSVHTTGRRSFCEVQV
jgi:hypothetical protein